MTYCTIGSTDSTVGQKLQQKTNKGHYHHHYSRNYPDEPEVVGSLSVFLLYFFQTESLGDNWTEYLDQIPFITPNEQCKNTKGNSKHGFQPGKITHWPWPFLIHCLTLEGSTVPLIYLKLTRKTITQNEHIIHVYLINQLTFQQHKYIIQINGVYHNENFTNVTALKQSIYATAE